jgi:hypothetical protein
VDRSGPIAHVSADAGFLRCHLKPIFHQGAKLGRSPRTRGDLLFQSAFDLLELDGYDSAANQSGAQKCTQQPLGADRAGLLISQPIYSPVDIAFQHIGRLGLEGVVSKKLGSRYERRNSGNRATSQK